MGWKELDTKDRWSLVTSGIQAAATVGMFIVTLVVLTMLFSGKGFPGQPGITPL